MRKVTMRHPDIEKPIRVPASAVPVWGAGGWVAVEDEPDPTPTPTTRKPRRAAKNEEND